MYHQCMQCKKVKILHLGDVWLELHSQDGFRISHGYCPDCKDQYLEQAISTLPDEERDAIRDQLKGKRPDIL